MSLASILDAVAAMPVIFNTQLVPVLYNMTLPETPNTAGLPARLLPGVDELRIEAVTGGMSARLTTSFVVRDVFLYKPLTQGGGADEFTQALRQYADAYIDACKARIGILKPTGVVERIDLRIGRVTYPVGGRMNFAGVEAAWAIREAR
jgi:hypothetical protein